MSLNSDLLSLLGMLILAALHGESSLRGMLIWGQRHWQQIWQPLGFKPSRSAPVDGTVWKVLAAVSQEALESVLGAWQKATTAAELTAVDVDGKQLRGSKRKGSGLAALHVVTAAAQGIGLVLGQATDAQLDDVAATVALLKRLPLENKVITLDAGLLNREVAQTILEKGGPISGYSRGITGKSPKR